MGETRETWEIRDWMESFFSLREDLIEERSLEIPLIVTASPLTVSELSSDEAEALVKVKKIKTTNPKRMDFIRNFPLRNDRDILSLFYHE